MASRLLAQIGKTQRLTILEEIKRAGRGLPVKELARRMKMSYMGVKDLCLDLEKSGLLKTWRNPRPLGRPELEYRLTRKAQDAFPQPDNPALLAVLQAAERLHGPELPPKLLMVLFQNKASVYRAKIRGTSPLDKAKWLARLRDREGHYAYFASEPEPILFEHHQPLLDVFAAFPEMDRMEEQMMTQILGCPVRRETTMLDGCFESRFRLLI